MATPVRKTFTTDVGQMQRRRHHMTACGNFLVSACNTSYETQAMGEMGK